MAHQKWSSKEAQDIKGAPLQQYKDERRVHERRNTEIDRAAVGRRVEVGDLTSVMASTVGLKPTRDNVVLAREGLYSKLTHERWI